MATGRLGTTPVLRTRWSKEPAGGTTSLSGLDDYSVSLVYEVGYEAVYQNGALLSRGNDYTATDGTTITLTNATVAGDIIEVFANNVVPLTDTYSQSVADGKFVNNTIVDAKGDLIVGSAADTFVRLPVGSANQVLTVDSATTSGLKWAAASGGMTLLSTTTLANTTTTVNIDPTGYVYIYFTISKMGFTGGATPLLCRLNGGTSSNYCYNTRQRGNTLTLNTSQSSISSVDSYDNSDSQYVWGVLTLPNSTVKRPTVELTYYYNAAANQGFGQTWGAFENAQAAITSITFFSSNGTSTFVNSPQLLIYGVK